MSARLRKFIGKKIFESVDNGLVDPIAIQNKVSSKLSLNTKSDQISFTLNVKSLLGLLDAQKNAVDEIAAKILSKDFKETTDISEVEQSKKGLVFHLDQNRFRKETLENAYNKSYYKLVDEPKQNIIVEYSSPNIAKPFHFGHLRSTIIGNFIANVFSMYDHNVTRINYLGDWGTQFGYLKLGMDMLNISDDEIANDPIKYLFKAYVHANKLGENDETIAQRARELFNQMENGDSDLGSWHLYRKYTVNEMERLYARLGVVFDVYAWESDYRKSNILQLLDEMSQFLETQPDGKVSFVLDDTNKRPILKSDGSTLYLTRDIAAVIDRQQKYKFDKMFYVAGNEQHHHFQSLFDIVKKLGVENSQQLRHIKFGRVEKMSTRKGNVVFLSDILDEVRELMYENQMKSATTKIDLTEDEKKTADILGVSAIIAFELQRTPTSSYELNLQDVIKNADSSGGNFQITHCRLCNLELRFPINDNIECDPKYLEEPEAIQLIYELARFPEVLYETKNSFGAQRMLTYMYSLNKRIKKALKTLNIKDEPDSNRQAQRSILFGTSRKILALCMQSISITPLKKM